MLHTAFVAQATSGKQASIVFVRSLLGVPFLNALLNSICGLKQVFRSAFQIPFIFSAELATWDRRCYSVNRNLVCTPRGSPLRCATPRPLSNKYQPHLLSFPCVNCHRGFQCTPKYQVFQLTIHRHSSYTSVVLIVLHCSDSKRRQKNSNSSYKLYGLRP